MNTRTSLALLVLLAALGSYVYFFEVGSEERKVLADNLAKQLFDLKRGDLTELELPLEGGGSARLVRESPTADWRLTAPLEVGVDRDAVDAVLAALEGLRYQIHLEQPPNGLEAYGLADGGAKVRASTPAGVAASFGLGKDSRVGNLTYISLEGPKAGVYAIEKSQRATLQPALYRLRDKRLLKVDAATVRSVRLTKEGTLLLAAQRAAPEVASSADPNPPAAPPQWQLEQPVKDQADSERIQRTIQDLTLARASGFIDKPGDLKTYGLDKPLLVFELGSDSGTSRLAIGKADVKVYARVDDGPVLEMRPRLYEDVPKDLFAYRAKRIVTVDEAAVRSIELAFPRDSKSYTFVHGSDGWTADPPSLEVESTRLDDVLFRLAQLDATGVEDGTPDRTALGLDPPAVRVTARGEGGKELARLDLGKPTPGLGLPAVSGDSTRVWRVINDVGEDIPLSVAAFEDKWVKQKAGASGAATSSPAPDAPEQSEQEAPPPAEPPR